MWVGASVHWVQTLFARPPYVVLTAVYLMLCVHLLLLYVVLTAVYLMLCVHLLLLYVVLTAVYLMLCVHLLLSAGCCPLLA